MQNSLKAIERPRYTANSRRILLRGICRNQASAHLAHRNAGDIPGKNLLDPFCLLRNHFNLFPHTAIAITILTRIRLASLEACLHPHRHAFLDILQFHLGEPGFQWSRCRIKGFQRQHDGQVMLLDRFKNQQHCPHAAVKPVLPPRKDDIELIVGGIAKHCQHRRTVIARPGGLHPFIFDAIPFYIAIHIDDHQPLLRGKPPAIRFLFDWAAFFALLFG